VAYIHPGSRLGVLLEVNCETDFVAAGDVFNKLANTVAMQIAANPSLEYVSGDEVPAEVLAKEREIEMGREDLQSKPEAIRAKIAEGRVKKLAQVRLCRSICAVLLGCCAHILCAAWVQQEYRMCWVGGVATHEACWSGCLALPHMPFGPFQLTASLPLLHLSVQLVPLAGTRAAGAAVPAGRV
jgi:hypothetical protein